MLQRRATAVGQQQVISGNLPFVFGNRDAVVEKHVPTEEPKNRFTAAIVALEIPIVRNELGESVLGHRVPHWRFQLRPGMYILSNSELHHTVRVPGGMP